MEHQGRRLGLSWHMATLASSEKNIVLFLGDHPTELWYSAKFYHLLIRLCSDQCGPLSVMGATACSLTLLKAFAKFARSPMLSGISENSANLLSALPDPLGPCCPQEPCSAAAALGSGRKAKRSGSSSHLTGSLLPV